MGARGNFNDFEKTVQEFTAKTLVDSEPPADATKSAYASLYEKQFRYQFYESYATGTKQATSATSSSASTARKSSGMTGNDTSGRAQEAGKAMTPAASSSSAQDQDQDDPSTNFSKTKNRFGELLGALPDEKAHEIHAAFGKILSSRWMNEETRFAVYRYAIFLLESPTARPFSPPPF